MGWSPLSSVSWASGAILEGAQRSPACIADDALVEFSLHYRSGTPDLPTDRIDVVCHSGPVFDCDPPGLGEAETD